MPRSPPAGATCRCPSPDAPTSGGRGASAPPGLPNSRVAALPLEVRPFLRRVRGQAGGGLGLPAWEWEAGWAWWPCPAWARRGPPGRGARLVAHAGRDLLVSLGFGGALSPELAAGDLVLGESFWQL